MSVLQSFSIPYYVWECFPFLKTRILYIPKSSLSKIMSYLVVNIGCIFSLASFCVYSSKYKYIYDQFLLISVANARCWLLLFKANRCFRMFWLWFPLLYNYQIPVSPKWLNAFWCFSELSAKRGYLWANVGRTLLSRYPKRKIPD